MMRRWAALFIAVLCLMTWASAEKTDGPADGEPALTRFWFVYGGYTRGHAYEVFRLGDEYYLCVDEAPSRKIGTPVIDALTGIIEQYGLAGWDGFHGNDPNVLDGEDFAMEFSLDDGTYVSASGSNDFPDRYHDASAEILELLEEANQGRIRDVTGIYLYEGEGAGGDFTITIARDGTYSFYEGPYSSYMGGGEWWISVSRMYLTETNGMNLYFTMIPVEDALIFEADEYSDNFPYIHVPDGGRFVRDESVPYGMTASRVFDSFDGGGPVYRIEIEDDEILTCYVTDVRYRDENHEELDGAAYDICYEFAGKKPGKTKVTVHSESPVAGNEERIFEAVVDEYLNVSFSDE